jgi:MFS transporter, FSR family, fosmidomycin resistance protein
MTLLLDRFFSSIAFGHLAVDLLNGSRAVLLAFLSGPLGLTNAAIGLISTLYVWGASLSQPVFGWLTDRLGPRWIAAGGVLWMAAFYGLALFSSGQTTLVWIMLASLGSGAFHPPGTVQAVLRGRSHLSNRETTAAAYYFLFGQLGFFFGPLISGPLLDRFGLAGLWLPVGFALPVGLNLAVQLKNSLPNPAPSTADPAFAGLSDGRSLIAVLALTAGLQAWAQQNMITFVPKYLADLGQTASVYGLVAALFMGGSALGNVLGGNLADRFDRRTVAVLALGLAGLPLYAIARIGWSPWLYLLVPLAGALTGSVHSILVVLAQRIIPSGMALASGLTLGFMFSAGALGTLFSGPLADAYGFRLVFTLTAGLTLTASVLAAFLRFPAKTPESPAPLPLK